MRRILSNKRAMTLIEILIVVALMSLISLSIYNVLSGGMKVWDRNRKLVSEEDIVIFFDKITSDLHNAYNYSLLTYKGNEFTFSFPTVLRVSVDPASRMPEGSLVDQLGLVEYSYDLMEDKVFVRKASYGQALKNKFGQKRILVSNVDSMKFNYFYLTDKGEIYSAEILDIIPSAISIEIEFHDDYGKRKMKKLIEVPIGN